jgi:hypothetical protein
MKADISTKEIIDRINELGENGIKILNKYCSEQPYHVPRETARGAINYLRKHNDNKKSLYYNRFNEFLEALSLI